MADPNNHASDSGAIKGAVKEAVDKVTEANIPVAEVTNVLEARLEETVAKYDDMMQNIMDQYTAILDEYIGKAEPIERRIERILQSQISGSALFNILEAFEKETNITSHLPPAKIVELIEPHIPRKAPKISARPQIAKPK